MSAHKKPKLLDRLRAIPIYGIRYAYYLVIRRRRDAHMLALISMSEYFDTKYYLGHNLDVAAARIDPVIHYLDFGAFEGRNPSAKFDTNYYLLQNPVPTLQNLNPLLHFLKYGQRDGRAPQKPYSFRRRSASPSLSISRNAILPTKNRTGIAPAPTSFVVYTAIADGYDNIRDLDFRPANCDLFVFSDKPIKAKGWTHLPFNYFHSDATRMARFVKLHPHLYFDKYPYSIWIDGNIAIQGDIGVFLERLGPDVFLSTFAHPQRDCIYDEGIECIGRGKDFERIIVQQLERYRDAGFGEGQGLWETNVLVRRHNDPACVALMSSWWQEIELGSRRDQLSLPIVTQRHGARITLLDDLGVNATNHPLLRLHPHNGRPRLRSIVASSTQRSGISIRRPTTTTEDSQPSHTVGICVHNALQAVRSCLRSVVKALPTVDQIIIVDDASDMETNAYLQQFAAQHSNVTLIQNDSNIGYTKSANLVLKSARTEWVTLLNSDTIVSRNGLQKVLRAGQHYPGLAAIGPLSNAASWQTVPSLAGPDGGFAVNPLPTGLTVDDMDWLCEEVAQGLVLFVPLVNGFCLTLRRSAIDVAGILDEVSFPLGYGEEDDLCMRLADKGYVCGIAADAYVFHVKSASFSATTRKTLVEAGRRALGHKHSSARIDAASESMRDNPALGALRRDIAAQLAGMSVTAPRRDTP